MYNMYCQDLNILISLCAMCTFCSTKSFLSETNLQGKKVSCEIKNMIEVDSHALQV